MRFSMLGVALAAAGFFASGARAQFSDNFDAYQDGSGLAGQGQWELWCFGGVKDATVAKGQARSAPNALRLRPGSDVVRPVDIVSGQWTISAWLFVPADLNFGTGAIGVFNTYCQGMSWSITTIIDPSGGIMDPWNGDSIPLVRDQWTEWRCEVDLDTDTFGEYYNDLPLSEGLTWSTNTGPGAPEIAGIELYSESVDGLFFDDVSIKPAGGDCYPDFTGDGSLDLFDFLAFVNAFNAGDDRADCDGNGIFDLFDFLCFVNAFNAGC